MPTRENDGEFTPPDRAYAHVFDVQKTDIDELGHANNVVWVRWVNEAAIAHSRHVGLGPDVYLALQVLWVVRRHDIEYLVPALEGERLEAMTWVATLRGATSLRRTLFRRASDGKPLARAATTWAMVDLQGRPRRVPPEILAKYGFSS
ncbi:MAG TPA: acyl-CoA thioesterase [Polyangiaceae bacterium]|nr:acyl-CoA thioesterase [Polyangiaceae bacterium]